MKDFDELLIILLSLKSFKNLLLWEWYLTSSVLTRWYDVGVNTLSIVFWTS